MSNNARDKAAQEEHFADIFACLREQDIEQFYAHYQLWVLRRRVPLLEKQLETLREHLTEHQQTTEALRPSALALAVLVRLQSNGVSDIDLLDMMLNRGEDWLDRMMQRLDYCEQVEDFIQGDYTQWCVKSLEGAYDWIDSLLGSIKEERSPQEKGEQGIIATEELLLQKLSLDDEEAMLEVTFTHPADAHSSEPAAAPSEQFVLTDKALLESEASAASDQFPELPGWKDLADLEAPATDPAPWYSVGVTENGASLTDDAEQAVSMNDWIQVLHADNVARTETDATASAATQPTSIDQPAEELDASSPISSDSTEVEAQTESTEFADNPATQITELPAEAQSEQEALVSAETEIVQSQETTFYAEAEVSASAENEQTTDETLVGTDESAPAISEQTSSADALLIEDEAISIIEEQPLVTASTTSTDEAAAIASEDIAHEEAPATHEVATAQTTLVDPTPVEAEEADTAEAQTSTAEAVLTGAKSTETSEDEVPSADLPGSAAEAGQAESGNEIETAAILNDMLNIEGEQEEQGEQMAWYEFLTLEESASDLVSTATAEQIEPEVSVSAAPIDPQASETSSVPEIIDLQASEASSESEIYEYTAGEEPAHTQSTPQQAGEDAGEIEGWQTWQGDESNEETLPFALKDLQSSQPARSNGAQEAEVSAISEVQAETEKAEVIDSTDAEEKSTLFNTEDAASALTGSDVDSDEISMDTAPVSAENTHVTIHDASVEVIADTDVRATTDNVGIAESDASDVSVVTEKEERSEMSGSELDEPTDLQSMSELNVYATFAEAEASAQAEKPLPGWSAPTSTSFALPELTAESAPTEEAAEISAESVFVLEDQQIARDEVNKIETVVEQVAVRLQVEGIPRVQPVEANEKPPKKPGFWRRLFRFGKKQDG